MFITQVHDVKWNFNFVYILRDVLAISGYVLWYVLAISGDVFWYVLAGFV